MGELCVMGEKQLFMKRRPGNRCMLAQDYSRIYSSEPCLCTSYDFEWYRKVLSNNCKEGGKNVYSPKRQVCRPRPPQGLRLSTSQGELSATVGSNVTFMVYLEDGDSLRTSIQLDFGDGIKITYSNLSRTDDGINHVYRTTGIYRVTASAENNQGSDSSTLFLHITSPVERVYLSAPIVAIRGKEVNLTAVVWPSHTRTLTFFWWFDNSSEVSGVPEYQLLVSLYPGLPSTAELFILPDEHTASEHKRGSEEALEMISDTCVTALNQGLIQFELKADIHIIVYMTQQTLAPLVDSNSIHSGSAMLMLLTVVFVGLAAFFIYKFKRKIPWIHVQAEDSHEKESEGISTVGQNDNMSKVKLSEFPSPKELMEKELEARRRGK
ncbi:VPS10 domain-containing receptor SorCS3 [Liparis tanakae]|uniref:VPS10 domain-containing receptor SorCS3 n=1 Tax=Liparis tanakae TaxID=230148 RepID=A0A4Z2IVC4_9TELE|nr:VPS10 domain-containing receptor SorCS3 [Liparis tanakae]